MGVFKLLGTEFQKLTGNKAVLFAIIGVLLIPIVYVAILLSTKMHPYDHMDNLPVAVVNKDVGGVSSGEPINVGNDLVQSLKESQTLGFEFVSAKEADKGLESNEYYLVIEIPEDFSQKVTTVLDANPQVPELRYIKNEGLNFTASSITNSAVEKIKEQLGDKITATYAKTVFSKFGDIAEGFESGADGSSQIFDGTNQLADGTGQILSSLKEKAPDINKLAAGAQELKTGMGTAAAGTKTLVSSFDSKVVPGSQTLAGGLKKLESGLKTLDEGSNKVTAGVKSVPSAFATKFSPAFASQFASGYSNSFSNQFAGKYANGFTTEFKGQFTNTFAKGYANGVYTNLETQFVPAVGTSLGAAITTQVVPGVLNQANTGYAGALDKYKASLEDALDGLAKGVDTTNSGIGAGLDNHPNLSDLTPGELATVKSIITGALTQYKNSTTGAKGQLSAGVQTVKTSTAAALNSNAEAIGTGVNTVFLPAFKSGLLTNIKDNLMPGVESGLASALNSSFDQYLTPGIENSVKEALAQNVGDSLSTNLNKELNSAIKTNLTTGIQPLVDGLVGTKTSKGLTEGTAEAYAAVKTQIAPGAKELSTGLTGAMPSIRELNAGLGKLNAGAVQIADGNATVATGWTTLTDGVTQVSDGVVKLQDGSKELSTGLSGGAEEVSAVQVSEENINMFASPVQLKGDTVNSYEFYRDSTAPFYISLALFVGMLILSFFVDFKKPAVMPGSAIAWYVSKWLQLAIFAVVQALLVSLVTLIVLGLSVSNAFLFILFTIFVSLTFMSIIFFLVAVGGHIGRFVAFALIILQISTTGGNLPVIMLSDGIQSIAKFLPLTYSNAGFKAIISLDDTSFLLSNVLTLLIYLVLFSVLTLVVFVASYKSLSVKADSSITSESAI